MRKQMVGGALRRVTEFMKDESGIFPFFGALGALGSAVGSAVIGTGISSVVGGFFDRRNARKNYQQQRDLGFTHSEIAGAGGANVGSAGESVMGNQFTQFEAQRRSMEFEHVQRQLDRDAGLERQAIAAQAALGSASIQADAAYNTARTNFDIAAMTNDRELQRMANEWAVNNPQLNMRLAQMRQAVPNAQFEMIARRNGLDLTGNTEYTPEEFNRVVTNVMSELSTLGGFGNIIREGGRQIMGATQDPLNNMPPILDPTDVPQMPVFGNGRLQ